MKRIDTFALAEELKNIDSVIPNINCGGCGQFAIRLHDNLNRHGIPNTIHMVIPSECAVSMTEIANNVNHGEFVVRMFTHFVIRINNRYFDSTGIVADDHRICRAPMQSYVLRWLLDNANWNRTYCKSHNDKMDILLTYAVDYVMSDSLYAKVPIKINSFLMKYMN